jgi:putative tricarboxylic transport membrane protein
MSSPPVPSRPPQVQGGKFSPVAFWFGMACVAVAMLGFISPSLGLPIGINLAVAWALAIVGMALIVPCFVEFKSLQDYAGGVFLIVIAVIGIAGTTGLNFRTSTGVGPGMMPRSTGLIIVALGLIMIVNGLFQKGEGLDRWSLRGIFFVLGAALLFAWTIRPLGLIIAGPLAVVFSAFADRDTKWLEVMIFSVIMTAACIALFSYGLKLPIPITPTQLPHIPGLPTIKF